MKPTRWALAWLMLLCYGLAYGAAWDLAWPTEVAQATWAKDLSGGAHLFMLALVLILWPRLNGARDTYGGSIGV